MVSLRPIVYYEEYPMMYTMCAIFMLPVFCMDDYVTYRVEFFPVWFFINENVHPCRMQKYQENTVKRKGRMLDFLLP